MGTHPDTDADTNTTAAAPAGHGGSAQRPASTTLDPRYSTPDAEARPLVHRRGPPAPLGGSSG